LPSTKSDDPHVADFLQVARMVTYSDVARRSREATASFRKNLTAMLESVEAHARAIRDFKIKVGKVEVLVGDARNAKASGIRPNSIDVIVTSPPYSIALDYVKNDEHALLAMGTDATALRHSMTGVRGRGAREKLALYNEDMRAVFVEVARVLKPGAAAAFVVGDATVDGREVTTIETMASWAEDAGLTREQSIPKIVFGLYSVMTDERILVFRKPV
jgi:tRNA G10  N-methylase Trm11